LAAAQWRGKTGKDYALSNCATPAITIARPTSLPASFPLPGGTVFTRLGRSHGVPLIEGRIPLDVDAATAFLNQRLRRAGYRLTDRMDFERGFLVAYSVSGMSGKLKIRALAACDGATRFAITARPTFFGLNPHAS
jgi:hypothetical protein